jgi:ferrochelatase
VGPLKWIGPSTVEEIARAGAEGLGVVVSPIAFVSEHVETLVELDHEYGALARQAGCPVYLRVPALGVEPNFIRALGDVVRDALGREGDPETAGGGRRCGADWCACPAETT